VPVFYVRVHRRCYGPHSMRKGPRAVYLMDAATEPGFPSFRYGMGRVPGELGVARTPKVTFSKSLSQLGNLFPSH
jgi:hypothetical protein